MTRLFYHTKDQLYFDHQAFVRWAQEMGLDDPRKFEGVTIQWIDQNGLFQVN